MSGHAMTPAAFKAWRKLLGLSQKEAAEALGLKRRVVQYYEKGERDGEMVIIPKTVRLACWTLLNGVTDYDGPAEDGEADRPLSKKEKKALKAVRDSLKDGMRKAEGQEAAGQKARTPDLGGAAAPDEADEGPETPDDASGQAGASRLDTARR